MSELNKLHKGAKVTLTVGGNVVAESECLGLFSSVLCRMVEESRLDDIIKEAEDLDPAIIEDIEKCRAEAKEMPESMKKIIDDWLEQNASQDRPAKHGESLPYPFGRHGSPRVYC